MQMSDKELQEIQVTVSELPSCVINELENYLSSVWDDQMLDSDHFHTFQALVVGYYAAWDTIEALKAEVERLKEELILERRAWESGKEDFINSAVDVESERNDLRTEVEIYRKALEQIEDESSREDACITQINGIARDALERTETNEPK